MVWLMFYWWVEGGEIGSCWRYYFSIFIVVSFANPLSLLSSVASITSGPHLNCAQP